MLLPASCCTSRAGLAYLLACPGVRPGPPKRSGILVHLKGGPGRQTVVRQGLELGYGRRSRSSRSRNRPLAFLFFLRSARLMMLTLMPSMTSVTLSL